MPVSRTHGRMRRAHYLAVYDGERAAETLVRTAVSARFMVRMCSPSPFRCGTTYRLTSDHDRLWLCRTIPSRNSPIESISPVPLDDRLPDLRREPQPP
jgi:hypothetical protein